MSGPPGRGMSMPTWECELLLVARSLYNGILAQQVLTPHVKALD